MKQDERCFYSDCFRNTIRDVTIKYLNLPGNVSYLIFSANILSKNHNVFIFLQYLLYFSLYIFYTLKNVLYIYYLLTY